MKKIIVVAIISVALILSISLIISNDAIESKVEIKETQAQKGEWIKLTDGRIVRVQK